MYVIKFSEKPDGLQRIWSSDQPSLYPSENFKLLFISSKIISYFEGLWRQLEPDDLSLFHAPPLLVKVIMEVIGQGITLLVMRIWLYLYQVRFSVIYWLKQGLSWTKNLECKSWQYCIDIECLCMPMFL